ncbi:MAG TPA: hypothetical protein VM345_03525 [Acidimicrobiales bacterium]|nr:hypothetical protein [Acidimicrobiales bacterium]
MHALTAAAIYASEAAGEHKELEMSDLLLYLGIIAAATFFIVLAGLGYFSPGSDKKSE